MLVTYFQAVQMIACFLFIEHDFGISLLQYIQALFHAPDSSDCMCYRQVSGRERVQVDGG